jgi:metal-responsive CopG/Arc/MetJ family transcriptional regulator
VELVLPEAWREELDAIADELATTRAVVIRDALELAYGERLPKVYRGASVIGAASDRKDVRSRARKAALAALAIDSTTDSSTPPTAH